MKTLPALRAFRVLPAILGLAALFCAAAPCALRAADKWLRLSSENFDMLSCSIERESREMLVQLEQFRATFLKLFPSKNTYCKRPLIFVFDNNTQYEPYKTLTPDGKAKDTQGVHFPGPLCTRFMVLNRSPEQGLSTLFHEYTHALLDARYGRKIPLWFNEGTAVVLSTFEVFGDNVTVGKASERYLPTLRRTSLIPAETFLSVNRGSPYYNDSEKIPRQPPELRTGRSKPKYKAKSACQKPTTIRKSSKTRCSPAWKAPKNRYSI